MRDVRTLRRLFTRDRGLSSLAVGLFALTMGVTIAVFAIVDAVVLRPPALVSPERIVIAWERDPSRSSPVVELALGEVDAWRRDTRTFEDLAVFGSVNWTLTVLQGDTPTRVGYAAVSPTFFAVAGVAPALGRVLEPRDDWGPMPAAAVISHRFWERQLGGDPAVIGKTVRVRAHDVDGAPVSTIEIVGVMPAAFDFPRDAMLWLPAAPGLRAMARAAAEDPEGESWYLNHLKVFYAVGRLRGGVSRIDAANELGGFLHPDVARAAATGLSTAAVTTLDDFLIGPVKPVLWLTLAGAGLMVLLACSSVAGLQVFRAARDDRTLAVRLALGASRGALLRQSLLESALVVVAGTVGAGAVASALTRALVAAAPFDVPRLADAGLSAPAVLGTTAGIALLSALVTGLWPALFVARVDPGRTLTTGARTALHPRERRLQRVVVGWQVAVAVVVLGGAGLFVRSVQGLDRLALGFAPSGLVAVDVEPSERDLAHWDQFYDELLSRTRQLPGVTAVGAMYLRPLSGPIGMDTTPVREDQAGLGPDAAWRTNPRANLEAVTPGCFRTLGTRILAGRDFSVGDRAGAPNVVIVSASAAAAYWPGQNPLGARVLVPTQRAPGTLEAPRWQTVVGVVEDVRYRGLTDPRLDVYMPAAQSTSRVKQLLLRTAAAPASVARSLRSIARELDTDVHIGPVEAMGDVVARESAPWRFAMRVLVGFGAVAAVLATVGLASLVSLVTSLRRRELGIRAALGASPARLRRHVLVEAFAIVGTATVIGLIGTVVAGALVRGLLVETTPTDLISLGGAAAVTVAAAFLGCLPPANRSASRDPWRAIGE